MLYLFVSIFSPKKRDSLCERLRSIWVSASSGSIAASYAGGKSKSSSSSSSKSIVEAESRQLSHSISLLSVVAEALFPVLTEALLLVLGVLLLLWSSKALGGEGEEEEEEGEGDVQGSEWGWEWKDGALLLSRLDSMDIVSAMLIDVLLSNAPGTLIPPRDFLECVP